MNGAIAVISARQDELITRRQALEVMTDGEVASGLGKQWQVVLPGVYAVFTGALSPRQRLRAALLHAGCSSMLNDIQALRLHRIPYLPDEDRLVRVLIPVSVHRMSRQFVVVRRTTRLPRPVMIDGLPVAPVYRALCEFVARHDDERESLAVAAAVVQHGRAPVSRLLEEMERGPARGRPRLSRTLRALSTGIRSGPEDDFRRIVANSQVMPEPLWNCMLELPNGRHVSPDALFVDAGLVHETNGRDVHAGFRDFDDMQSRHDEMTAAGLTVLHNAPRRLRDAPAAVLEEVERCYLRSVGRGLPDGVHVIVRGNAPSRSESA